jgi:hypothetical protein
MEFLCHQCKLTFVIRFSAIIKKGFYWPPKLQLYGPPYTGQPVNICPCQTPILSTLNETKILIFLKVHVRNLKKILKIKKKLNLNLNFKF